MARHTHGHSHSHAGHGHDPGDYGRAFQIGIALNAAFIAVEIGCGLKAGSLALIADAGHNIGDVLGLFVAWGAVILARRKPTSRHTYGLRGSSIVAALANAVFLLVATGGIAWEALLRLGQPGPVAEIQVMAIAASGIVVNGATALLFMRGGKHDLNLRGAFLHMAADAAVSAGVVLSGFIMLQTGWLWLDPVTGILIALAIMAGSWGLLRDSLNLSLHAVPASVDYASVKACLETLDGVREIHDLHIWAISTSETALTAHLVMRDAAHPGDAFLRDAAHRLAHLGIAHPTLQIELGDCAGECSLQEIKACP